MGKEWDRRREPTENWRLGDDQLRADIRELRAELEVHRKDGFAHAMLIDRLSAQARNEHDEMSQRIGKLEAFRSQATLLGAIGFTVLGALAFAVAERFIVHGVP